MGQAADQVGNCMGGCGMQACGRQQPCGVGATKRYGSRWARRYITSYQRNQNEELSARLQTRNYGRGNTGGGGGEKRWGGGGVCVK